jgi:alpha-galactosidase
MTGGSDGTASGPDGIASVQDAGVISDTSPLGELESGSVDAQGGGGTADGTTSRRSDAGGLADGGGSEPDRAAPVEGGIDLDVGSIVEAAPPDGAAERDATGSDVFSAKDGSGETESGSADGALAATPPMGWNSWNHFAGNINETVLEQAADAMVSTGMQAVGYQFVNIDDTWASSSRDSSGNLVANPSKFPSGMKALADYVHAKGLKLGIYGDRGTKTCSGYPGSYGYEQQDAATFASWGIDYLKYDNCSPSPASSGMQQDYTAMSNALKASGRAIVFSECAWWFYTWEPTVGNLWRTTTDITDTWASFTGNLDKNGGTTARYSDASYGAPGLAQYAGPGHWNDPDMLEVGNGGMTDTEDRAQFSLWSIMAAPLITGNDLSTMSATALATLTNAEVIAVDQDPLGIQGQPISASTTLEVWSKRLATPSTYAVVLFNRTAATASITVTWSSLGLTSSSAAVRDLWAQSELGSMTDQYTASVDSHGVVMVTVTGQ